jgi:transposase
MKKLLIGVDPHKATNAAVAIDEHGELVAQAAFPANRGGIRALERWAKRFVERRWAIEGATGIGRPLAQKLAASGEEVVDDVPPKLSAKVRVLSTGNVRKNDRLDATFTALAALRNERLARVHPEDGLEGRVEILRLLTERREDLVAERTRALNPACTSCCETFSPTALPRVSRRGLPQSFCAALVPAMPRDRRESGWPPSWCAMCAPSIGRLPLWTSASGRRWRLPVPPSPRSSA